MNDVAPQIALTEIEQITQDAAHAVQGLIRSAGLGTYKNFLHTMYHYTRYSGDKAHEAAEGMPTEELHAFFLQFEKEEGHHYILARHDLKEFGLEPLAETPQPVSEFNEYWASLKGRNALTYLGALYVFENIIKYLAGDVMAFISGLQLAPAQTTFLATHAKADLEHGDEVGAMLRKYVANDPSLAVESARRASQLWVAIMRHAFEMPLA